MIRWLDRLLRRAEAVPPPPGEPKPREELTEDEWKRLRAPERHRDQTLSDVAKRWLAWLPDDVRPVQLAERYPRVVNRLVVCWSDAGLADFMFYDLTVDRRGTRQGFPPEIKREIERLREFHEMSQMAAENAAESAGPRGAA